MPLEIETNSFTLAKMVKGGWEVPWSIIGIITRIQQMMEDELIKVQYIYREWNSLADCLANLCFSFAGTVNFNTFMELPRKAKAITIQDKKQIPHIRVGKMRQQAPD